MLGANEIAAHGDEKLLRDAAVELQRKSHCSYQIKFWPIRSGTKYFRESVADECKRAEKSGNRDDGGAERKTKWTEANSQRAI